MPRCSKKHKANVANGFQLGILGISSTPSDASVTAATISSPFQSPEPTTCDQPLPFRSPDPLEEPPDPPYMTTGESFLSDFRYAAVAQNLNKGRLSRMMTWMSWICLAPM